MVVTSRGCSRKRRNKYDIRLIGFDFNKKRMLIKDKRGKNMKALSVIMKKINNMKLKINNEELRVGMDKNMRIWCEMPLEKYKITQINKNIYKIKLKGITILVIRNVKEYKNLKEKAKELIKYYNIDDSVVGVMFV